MLALPAPERVVAQHEQDAVDRQLGIVLHARPAGGIAGRGRVVVAADEVLDRRSGSRAAPARPPPPRDVAEVPDLVSGPTTAFHPATSASSICGDRGERPALDVDRAVIAEVGVGGEEHGHSCPLTASRVVDGFAAAGMPRPVSRAASSGKVRSAAARFSRTCAARAGLRDRDHAVAPQGPGERDLRGRRAQRLRRPRRARGGPPAAPARPGCRPSRAWRDPASQGSRSCSGPRRVRL